MALVIRNHAMGAADAMRVLGERRVDAFRHGRNFVRVGDVVHVKPSRPGRRDGFDAHVISIRARDIGGVPNVVTGVDVVDPYSGGVRTVTVDRVERKAQTRGGEAR